MTSTLDSRRVGTHRTDTGLDVVTGAFSYSGSAIARALMAGGRTVRTLTGHPERAGTTRISRPAHWTSTISWPWSTR